MFLVSPEFAEGETATDFEQSLHSPVLAFERGERLETLNLQLAKCSYTSDFGYNQPLLLKLSFHKKLP